MTYTEMRHMAVGFILDMFTEKQRYDMAMHQLKFRDTGGAW